MNAYNVKGNVGVRRNRSALGTAIRFLRAVAEVVWERVSALELRPIAVVLGFVFALFVIGGMESGTLPIYIGLPVCLAIGAAALLVHFED